MHSGGLLHETEMTLLQLNALELVHWTTIAILHTNVQRNFPCSFVTLAIASTVNFSLKQLPYGQITTFAMQTCLPRPQWLGNATKNTCHLLISYSAHGHMQNCWPVLLLALITFTCTVRAHPILTELARSSAQSLMSHQRLTLCACILVFIGQHSDITS